MDKAPGARDSQDLAPVIQRIAESAGLELVEWKWIGPTRRPILRVLVDKFGGVTIDECAALSRTLSFELDVEVGFNRRYVLEVGSPGLDRPLKTPRDFRRKLGKKVTVSYAEGDKAKEIKGDIEEVADDRVKIGETWIDFSVLKQGRIVI